MASPLVMHIETFNSTLRILVRSLAGRLPNDVQITRIQKSIVLVIDTLPLYALEQVGPYLYKYKDSLAREDIDFFLANDYQDELSAAKDANKRDAAAFLIPKLKECAASMSRDEQEECKSLALDMLVSYMEYLHCTAAQRESQARQARQTGAW